MLGENIKTIRIQQRLSINELARRCKMSPGYLSDLEKGNKENPSIERLQILAKELGTTVQQLFKKNVNEIDEIDQLEEDMKLLYSKVKDLSKKDRKKLLDVIKQFEEEIDN